MQGLRALVCVPPPPPRRRNTAENKRIEYLQCLRCKCLHVGGRESGVRTESFSTLSIGPTWAREQAENGVEPYVTWFPARKDICSDTFLSVAEC
jgi:hypothetical protein